MTFEEYDKIMLKFQEEYNIKPENKMMVFALGVGEEAGEVLGKIKRNYRGDKAEVSEILKEIGDLLGYLSCLTNELGSNLSTVANMNIVKIQERVKNKTLLGKGDNR